MKRFLEYVKSLAVTYGMATTDEKSQIVKIVSSNRTVERKNIYIEPANWLLVVSEALAGLVGGHCRDTTLSSHGTTDSDGGPSEEHHHFKRLLESFEVFRQST